MQLLLTEAAFERVKDRLLPIARDLDIVTLAPPDIYRRKGAVIPAAAVDPEIIWASIDSYKSGLLFPLFGRASEGRNIKWVQSLAAGVDNPAFTAILAKGVRLTKANAQAIAIAEYIVGHAISLILPIAEQAALQTRKEWRETPFREIGDTRWLLVGFGSIGRAIAERIKPFGVHLTVVRHSPARDPLIDELATLDQLPQLLPQADVVVLACALNDETRGLANAAFFERVKPGAILLNIGRGGLIDEEALKRGLDADRPRHAVLDVFKIEPLPTDSWIWSHPKIRVSAHTSNLGNGTLARSDTQFLENLKRYLAGEPLRNEAQKWEVGL